MKRELRCAALALSLAGAVAGCARDVRSDASGGGGRPISDHFDGAHYFNPWIPAPASTEQASGRRRSWIWGLLFGNEWPPWPEHVESAPGPRLSEREPRGTVRVTLVNHATFLIQMDGLNFLTDPIWSERCSPVSWAGPKRHRPPGLRFEDLPPIDAVLVSHNHYDHLDLPTLERLSDRFHPRAFTPLENGGLLRGAGLSNTQELDWWEAVPLSPEVTVTLVPAQHFSSRTLWNRNEALWGGFVLSGPAGNVYFAGDTGYGPHFREIGKRFAPPRFAILPISPFHPVQRSSGEAAATHAGIHLDPEEAVQAHLDLGARTTLAGHFQTFQLGSDNFEEAPMAVVLAAKARGVPSDALVIPAFGQGLGNFEVARCGERE